MREAGLNGRFLRPSETFGNTSNTTENHGEGFGEGCLERIGKDEPDDEDRLRDL